MYRPCPAAAAGTFVGNGPAPDAGHFLAMDQNYEKISKITYILFNYNK